MKLNWNFLGGGGRGVQNKNLSWGKYMYGYFLKDLAESLARGCTSKTFCCVLIKSI